MKTNIEKIFDILEQNPILIAVIPAAYEALDEGCSNEEAIRIGKAALAASTLTEEEARKFVESARKELSKQYPHLASSSAQ